MVRRRTIQQPQYYYEMPTQAKKRPKRGIIYNVGHISANPKRRLFFLMFFVFLCFVAITSRLFYLQIVKGDTYFEKAFDQQHSRITIPAQRGEIFMSSSKTGEKSKVATNVSLDLVYIDPTFIPDKAKIAKELAPILFGEEDYKNCKSNIKLCPRGSTVSFDEGITLQEKPINGSGAIKDNRTMDELISDYADDIFRRISKQYNDFVPLKYGATEEEIAKIKALNLTGLFSSVKNELIYADPLQIPQTQINHYAVQIKNVLPDMTTDQVRRYLKKRKIQYIPLKRKIPPEISEKIMELKIESYEQSKNSGGELPHFYKGVVLLKEHWRYYPENNLASQVIGFVDHDGIGRYGIEESLNPTISGQNGTILNRKNIKGEFIFFDEKSVQDAKNGDSFVLTIDKVIQQKTEELLKQGVIDTNADSGEAIVINPNNGHILAAANYPSYNPNNYGEVYKINPIKEFIPPDDIPDLKPSSEEEGVRLYYTKPVFVKNDQGELVRFHADEARDEDIKIREAWSNSGIVIPRIQKYMYENGFGLRNYINHLFSSTYEPGSVFKSMVVASALDANEVDPSTTYEEFGPIEVDTGTTEKQLIRTAENIYRGIQTVTNAIEHSSNIGLAFVARKLGKQLFYEYITGFHFGEIFGIETTGEQSGRVKFWKKWNEANLLTTSFGQGISSTPLHMATAYGALANGGKLVKPMLIKQIIRSNGEVEDIRPEIVRQVISEKASAQITSILVSSIENGAAANGGVKGYKVAGKTGTAQIACTDSRRCIPGRYEPKKEGHFITSYGGYAPAENPKFAIIVKINRARMGPKTYGSNTAAPIFSKITEYLLKYYSIEPSKIIDKQ